MPRTPQDITEAELAILQVLWEAKKSSIRQITDALYPKAGAAQYATVQKQLERMEAKEFVVRDRSLFVHVFSPAVDRDELIGRDQAVTRERSNSGCARRRDEARGDKRAPCEKLAHGKLRLFGM